MYKLHDHDTLTQDSGLGMCQTKWHKISISWKTDCLSKYYFSFIFILFIINDTK